MEGVSRCGWVLPFFTTTICDSSASRSGWFTIGKRYHFIFRGPLVEVTPVCETADTHRPPHVLGIFATAPLSYILLSMLHHPEVILHTIMCLAIRTCLWVGDAGSACALSVGHCIPFTMFILRLVFLITCSLQFQHYSLL